jgi:hypothetical protein
MSGAAEPANLTRQAVAETRGPSWDRGRYEAGTIVLCRPRPDWSRIVPEAAKKALGTGRLARSDMGSAPFPCGIGPASTPFGPGSITEQPDREGRRRPPGEGPRGASRCVASRSVPSGPPAPEGFPPTARRDCGMEQAYEKQWTYQRFA